MYMIEPTPRVIQHARVFEQGKGNGWKSRPNRQRAALTSFVLAAVAVAVAAPGAHAATDPAATLGVYVGPNLPAKVATYEQWRGRPVSRVVDFIADDSWSSISAPSWWINGWSSSAYRSRLVYSVPMLPRNEGTMQAGAKGDYNARFVSLAKALVAAGQGSVVIRIGWEMNGNWYRWSAAPDPQAYINYFRHIVTAMRSVSGANFSFEWTANMGPSAMPADQAYPGDAYVDTIGLDVYDHYWGPNPEDPEVRWKSYLTQPYGLNWHRDFAKAHGKPMTFPEWGVIIRSDGSAGGGDNPVFVQRMYDWIAANNVAWSAYFEYDSAWSKVALMGGQFPKSAQTFLQLFGPSTTTTTPTPTPTTDTAAPVTQIACNGTACSGSKYSKSVTVTLAASDGDGSGVATTKYTTDGSTPSATNGVIYTGAFTLTKTTTVKFRSWDAAGNAESVKAQKLSVR